MISCIKTYGRIKLFKQIIHNNQQPESPWEWLDPQGLTHLKANCSPPPQNIAGSEPAIIVRIIITSFIANIIVIIIGIIIGIKIATYIGIFKVVLVTRQKLSLELSLELLLNSIIVGFITGTIFVTFIGNIFGIIIGIIMEIIIRIIKIWPVAGLELWWLVICVDFSLSRLLSSSS